MFSTMTPRLLAAVALAATAAHAENRARYLYNPSSQPVLLVSRDATAPVTCESLDRHASGKVVEKKRHPFFHLMPPGQILKMELPVPERKAEGNLLRFDLVPNPDLDDLEKTPVPQGPGGGVYRVVSGGPDGWDAQAVLEVDQDSVPGLQVWQGETSVYLRDLDAPLPQGGTVLSRPPRGRTVAVFPFLEVLPDSTRAALARLGLTPANQGTGTASRPVNPDEDPTDLYD